MIGSEKVRAARKKGQLERHAIKKKSKGNEYAKWFAAQPKQQLKAKVNEQLRVARQGLRDAIETLQVAEETGEDILNAQENAHVARLYVEKLDASKRVGSAMSLTSAGGAA